MLGSCRRTRLKLAYWAIAALLSLSGTGLAQDAQKDSAGIDFFETKIRPVLVESCYKCHSIEAKKHKGNLLLDSQAALRKGGDTGPAIVPGQPGKSLLVKALRHSDDLSMPPQGKLSDQIIADFEKWIALGAPDPRDGAAVAAQGFDWAKVRHYWAFQPPRMPGVPDVKDRSDTKTPLDHFILAKLEAEKLTPAGMASKRELIRRATFDLIGLPPTPGEVESFLQDDSPQAFARLIERLLQSPHYGERWGRYWLDVARYAEDQAHTFGVKPNTNAWRYRDWVINAFNSDMPYDRFVKLQLAADFIEKNDEGRVQHLPALGFIGLGAQYYKNSDKAKSTADELDDRVDTVTRGLLGLTVSCARCHEHKFDPIPQQDYYSLAGVFASCKLANLTLANKEQQQRADETQKQIKKADDAVKAMLRDERLDLAATEADQVSRYLMAAWKYRAEKSPAAVKEYAKVKSLDAAIMSRAVKLLDKPGKDLQGFIKIDATEAEAMALADKLQSQVQKLLTPAGKGQDPDKSPLLQKLFLADTGVFFRPDAQVRAKLPEKMKQRLDEMNKELTALQQSESGKPLPIAHGLAEGTPANMKVFVRGNPAKLGDEAPRRFLKIIAGDNPTPFATGSGRLELAEAIAAPDNPLTARVMVNRVWQHHFGRGLVGTPSNFGQLGERPTHPELLDYLTCRFIESGWSIKTLHREIMLSAAYQRGGDALESNLARDADNRWLWRMNRRRLDVEAWRDAMLAVSGKLDPSLGGPTVDLAAASNTRRTVYAKISRHDLNYLLRLFDFPDANITSERRTETTVPQQQLFVINSAFVIDQAKGLAARVERLAPNEADRLQALYGLAFGRPATAEEVTLASTFLGGQDEAQEQSANRLSRWERLAQIMLGSNEFLYID